MTYSPQALNEAVKLGKREIPPYTGRIICVPKKAKGPKEFRGGSCVFVTITGTIVVVTALHVIDNTERVYVTLPTSDEPTPLGQTPADMTPATILAEDQANDLSIIDGSLLKLKELRKRPYNLEDSNWITEAVMRAHIGGLSFECGAWGKKSYVWCVEEAKIYIETPLYFGAGPIKSVDPLSIVASFNERKEVFKNVKGFPQLADVKISGRSRDLSGMSGSGLWIIRDHTIHLAGILHGPASGKVGDPNIRFTPVWVLRDFVRRALTTSTEPEKP